MVNTTTRTKHVLDYLVGESRRDIALSIFQVVLYILGMGIMLLVLYLLVRKVLPVTNSVIPLVSTKLIPTVHSSVPVITDVIETIQDENHKPSQQISKIIQDIVWNAEIPPYKTNTRIGSTVAQVEKLVGTADEILNLVEQLVNNKPHNAAARPLPSHYEL